MFIRTSQHHTFWTTTIKNFMHFQAIISKIYFLFFFVKMGILYHLSQFKMLNKNSWCVCIMHTPTNKKKWQVENLWLILFPWEPYQGKCRSLFGNLYLCIQKEITWMPQTIPSQQYFLWIKKNGFLNKIVPFTLIKFKKQNIGFSLVVYV